MLINVTRMRQIRTKDVFYAKERLFFKNIHFSCLIISFIENISFLLIGHPLVSAGARLGCVVVPVVWGGVRVVAGGRGGEVRRDV